MISGDPNKWQGVTYATADNIQELGEEIGDILEGSYGQTFRIADDLNSAYRAEWFDNRYKIIIILEKI